MARQLLTDDTFEVKETDLALDIAPDPDAVYVLRALSSEAARRLAKPFTRVEFSRAEHRKIEVIDTQGLNDAIIDYVIVNWRGVIGECSQANKLRLPVPVQKALLEKAQEGQGSAEVRAASFRESA